MGISDSKQTEFLEKMRSRVAAQPQAPLRVVEAKAEAATPPAAAKQKPPLVERTMSFKLAEQDYEGIEGVIFERRRKGEKRLSNKEVGREMVRDWLLKHGAEAFDYKATD